MAGSGPSKPVAADVVDQVLSTLARRDNRYVLGYLHDSPDEVASLGELVDHVLDRMDSADREGSGAREGGSSSEDGAVSGGGAASEDGAVSGAGAASEDGADSGGGADPDGTVDTSRRKRVTARLHHSTLPKLADAGVVDYDPRTGTVRYRGHPLVDRCSDHIVGME